MNRTISYILVGGASALVGAVAGYFFCKKQMQNKIDDAVAEKVNEELKCLRRMKNCPTDWGAPLGEEKGTPGSLDPIIEQAIPYPRYRDFYFSEAKKMIRQMFPDETVNEYRVNLVANCLVECHENSLNEEETEGKLNELFASFESPHDDYPEEDLGVSYEDNVQAVMDDYASHPPHVISIEEYESLPPSFEFLTYHYFEDDVLIDDGDEIITDPEKVVGDALVHFGNDQHKDIVYVVNGQYGSAIEIIRVNSTYEAWGGFGG